MRQLITILLLISAISCSGKNDSPGNTQDKPQDKPVNKGPEKISLKDYQTITCR
jgi:hypothetical protein